MANDNRVFKNPWNNVLANGHLWNGQLRTTQRGTSFFTGSLSIYDGKDPSGDVKYQKIPVKAFGRDADALSKVQNGSEVLVEGKLQTDTYEKDGEKRYMTYVLIRNYAEEQKPTASSTSPYGQQYHNDPAEDQVADIFGDDLLPF